MKHSILEIFREDISRFPVLLALPSEENDDGEVPQLRALRLHNGTIYRWNRPCYGISNGKPHLRIENRILPAGPSILDEVANAAFYFGMMCGVTQEYGDVATKIAFDPVKDNFLAAARTGLQSQFRWPGHDMIPARRLILERLLPMAREGLIDRGVDSCDADGYLSVIRARVEDGQTGSAWTSRSLDNMPRAAGSRRFSALTADMHRYRKEKGAIHLWPLAQIDKAGSWESDYIRIEQYMTTDLITVGPDDSVQLVANLMDWQKIRHIPVEDQRHGLLGLISYRSLLRFFARSGGKPAVDTPATDIMRADPTTTSPGATTLEAIELMRQHSIGCLPVVNNDRLVGIVTERDFMRLASDLVESRLRTREDQVTLSPR